MKAVLCGAFGAPSQLELGETQPPQPKAGEVRIAVHAAGVNFADSILIAGKYGGTPDFPFTPGMEAAGVVESCGEGVTQLKPGERVIAMPRMGAYAETLVAPADKVYRIPQSLDFVTAVGFPIAYLTALGALEWRAGLKPGETLLVTGAAGGVGIAAVEIGKALGARVLAAAGSAEKLAIAASHGAHERIDYETEDLRARLKSATGGKGVDVVLDLVGGAAMDEIVRALAWNARLLIVGWASGQPPQIPGNLLWFRHAAALGFTLGFYGRQTIEQGLQRLYAWVAEGKLKPHVSRTYALERAPEALESLLARRAVGKLVLSTGR